MCHKPLSTLNLLILSMPLMFTAYTKAQNQPLFGFENKAVEQAYNDESRSLSKGILFGFEPNNLPNEEEQKIIFDITRKAGLKELEINEYKYVTVWAFDWPYWRFTEESSAVCEQFKEKADHLRQNCRSSIRVIVWSN